MSSWTHIRGAVNVSVPGRSQPEIQYILDSVLEHLPLVTGSEGDMVVHVARHSGFTRASSHDEFGMKTNNLKDWYGDHSRRGMHQTQDRFVLALEGDLRDREFEWTKAEFLKWLCRLAKRVYVDDVLVRVYEDCGQSMLIDDMHKFFDMNESTSRRSEDGKPSWWEYLMWERDPVSWRPLMHVYKYMDDPDVDQEMERRRKWEEDMENGD